MTTTDAPKISLEQAKQLVAYLEAGEQQQADDLLVSLAQSESNKLGDILQLDSDLFGQIGKLTRQLHTALTEFQLDPRITDLAHTDIPDAQSRLNYVIEMTEQAANKTMDAVEFSLPVADKLSESLANLHPRWRQVMSDTTSLDEFKGLCQDTHTFISEAQSDATLLNTHLKDVLMAQDFQDLTGQVIRRVIQLVQEVEESLISMLKVFGETSDMAQATSDKGQLAPPTGEEAEGPIIDAESRTDVVSGQDDVDDLLSSLGF